MARVLDESPRILEADAEHCIASCAHVLILSWGKTVTASSLRAVHRAHHELITKYPEGLGCLTIANGTRAPDVPISEAAQLVKATYKNVRWSACVMIGEGFLLSAARAALTSILTLSGQVSFVRPFRELPEALDWQEVHASGLGLPSPILRKAANEALAAMVS